MAHPIYDLAVQEHDAALTILADQAPEAFAAWQRAKATMEVYKDVSSPSVTVAPKAEAAPQQATPIVRLKLLTPAQKEAVRVVEATEKMLELVGRRLTSGQVTKQLLADGHELSGADLPGKAGRVSAHLSAAKKIFDNDRDQGGYGLVRWGGGAGPRA